VLDRADNRWSQVAQLVFWSEHVTPHKCIGCSPYFAVTGTHPLLPFDIIEANYLLPPPDSLLLTTNLIVCHMVALQKRQTDLTQLRDCVHKTHNHMALRFKCDNAAIICNFNFKSGDLVLLCNTAIEKALNHKMHPQYFSPMVIVSQNRGSTYIVCNLDGTLAHMPITAFRMVPYFAHENIDLPDLE